MVLLRLAQLLRHCRRHQLLDEEVLLDDLPLHPAHRHDSAKQPESQRCRPEPRVAEHDARNPVGAPGGDGGADRTAPVLSHHDELVERELIHELAYGADVLFNRVAVMLGAAGETEAEVVNGHAPEAIAQTRDDAAVKEAPGRVSVAEKDWPTGAFIDVVHPAG